MIRLELVNGLFELLNQEIRYNRFMNKFNYEMCKEEASNFKLEYIELLPNPPRKKNELQIKIKGYTGVDITDGVILDTIIKYQRLTIIKKRFDVCKELNDPKNHFPIKCPIIKGEKIIEYKLEIPNNIPNGKYNINLELKNEKDLFFCIKIYVELYE